MSKEVAFFTDIFMFDNTYKGSYNNLTPYGKYSVTILQ